MRFKNLKKIIIFLAIPAVFVLQFYLFKLGILSPQVKGIDIQIISGDYIKDIDKYIVKEGEQVVFSPGDYIKFPTYAKDPDVELKSLDSHSIVDIDDNSEALEDTFTVVGNKKGLASVAIVANGRILKKFNILVVNPTVTNLNVEVDKKLKYVGDKAQISSDVEVDFDRFNEDYSIEYRSSNEAIVKVEDNKLYAVGVGKAKVTASIGNKKETFEYNIAARLKSILVEKNIDLEVEEKKNISAGVITSPKNLKTPRIKYSFLDTKLPVDRKIRLDEDGRIVGLREGTEKVLVSCGSGENRVSKIVYVKVNEISVDNKKIENLDLEYYFDENDKLALNLSWDSMKGAKKYKIYLRDNLNDSKKYRLIKTLSIDNLKNDSKKVTTHINLNETKFNSLNYDLYVVGCNNRQISQKSEVYNIKHEQEEQDNVDLE